MQKARTFLRLLKGKIATCDNLATESQFLERDSAFRLSFAIRPCLRCAEDSNAAQLQRALGKQRSRRGCCRLTNEGRRWGKRRPSGSGLCVAIGASSGAERLKCLARFHFQSHSRFREPMPFGYADVRLRRGTREHAEGQAGKVRGNIHCWRAETGWRKNDEAGRRGR